MVFIVARVHGLRPWLTQYRPCGTHPWESLQLTRDVKWRTSDSKQTIIRGVSGLHGPKQWMPEPPRDRREAHVPLEMISAHYVKK